MKRKAQIYNPKRKILPAKEWDNEKGLQFARETSYGGNPEHKKNPGDYGLTPPQNPRPGKTLCDAERAFLKEEALALLQRGFLLGMVSVRTRNGWPQNVWAVSESGEAFEAQLENQDTGVYHGYPMPEDDDFRGIVIEEWQERES